MATSSSRFAENTSVSVEKSQSEIRALLTRYGATHWEAMVSDYFAKMKSREPDFQDSFDPMAEFETMSNGEPDLQIPSAGNLQPGGVG